MKTKKKETAGRTKRKYYERLLIEYLECLCSELSMKKTPFKKCLAEEMITSESTILNYFRKRAIPDTWSFVGAEVNNISRLVHAVPKAIDKYAEKKTNKEMNITLWKEKRDQYINGLVRICNTITLYSRMEAVQDLDPDWGAKLKFTAFMIADWSTDDLTDEQSLRRFLVSVQEYLQTHIDLEKHTVSQREIDEMREKLKNIISQKIQ